MAQILDLVHHLSLEKTTMFLILGGKEKEENPLWWIHQKEPASIPRHQTKPRQSTYTCTVIIHLQKIK